MQSSTSESDCAEDIGYVPLWVKSNHSFLEGASHPEELVERAHALGLSALAITDRDGLYGAVKAHVKAKELGIKLILGSEITVSISVESEVTHHIVLLARTRAGYASLCQLISRGRDREEKGSSRVTMDEVCRAALISSAGSPTASQSPHESELIALCPEPSLLALLKTAFGKSLYALCTRHLLAEDVARERALRERARALGVALVASTEVLYHDEDRRPLQDVLTCIRHGVTVRDAGCLIRANAEHDLKSTRDMNERFADLPEALAESVRVAAECTFSYDELRYRYPAETLPSGLNESAWLRQLTFEGAQHRYPEGVPAAVEKQLESELSLIQELDYGGYFLTMYEIVQFCRREGILCQGRGSAANSAVCFCLGVTAIDPIKMDLLFERFLSRERAEPPDIDLDIEHNRREEVIQEVYRRYGRRHAAMVANLIRYRERSAVRDVGKALGIAATELDGIARLLGHFGDRFDEATLRGAGLDTQSPALAQLLVLCREIKDFPRHLSIHPGGFLLGHEPVDSIVPIERATMEGRTVIQWDKYDVEALGLFKVDLLGLGALTAIKHSLNLLKQHKQLPYDMATLPKEDRETYEMISRGDTVGVFQIESRAQMAMLPRLKPKEFYDLVIEVAIVRPGPIQGDMVHPYLRRRTGEEPEVYPHESLKVVLAKTKGIPIFQEQVMKLAVLAADYTPGESDQLRRDMAAWRSSGRIEQHHEQFVGRMVKKGISAEFAERVFSQIRGFGEYGFPESHAASFALLAYITAFLHCHHPEVFLCAMLNSQPMGFYSSATLIEDAQRHGVITLPIDVNHSRWECTLEQIDEPLEKSRAEVTVGGPRPLTRSPLSGERPHRSASFARKWAVRMGFCMVKGLGTREQERLEVLPRPVRTVEDFARKTQLSLNPLVALAEAGAFESLGHTRREALWRVRAACPSARDPMRSEPGSETPALRPLSVPEQVLWDYRSAQHSTRGHPMEPLRPWLAQRGIKSASEVRELPSGRQVECVGLVICRQRPGTATGVVFLTLEDEQGFINVVIWTAVFERYQRVARTASLLGVRGKIQAKDGVVHLIAEELYAPNVTTGGEMMVRSRDFH